MSSRWLRLNIDWDDSPWVFTLHAESQLAWIKLLCHIKRDGTGGKVKSLAPLVAAKKWGIGEEAVVKMLQAGINDGAIQSEDGYWTLTQWNKYQGTDPTNAERQRRYRRNKTKSDVVFARDDYSCKICGSSEDLVVDHVVPVSKGGDTVLENLQTLCRSCNARKKDTDSNGVTNVAAVRATETETETETLKETSKEKFKRPTLEDCREQAKAKGIPEEEGEKFWEYNEARDWMMGKSRMKNWKQGFATWARNYRAKNPEPKQVNKFEGYTVIGRE